MKNMKLKILASVLLLQTSQAQSAMRPLCLGARTMLATARQPMMAGHAPAIGTLPRQVTTVHAVPMHKQGELFRSYCASPEEVERAKEKKILEERVENGDLKWVEDTLLDRFTLEKCGDMLIMAAYYGQVSIVRYLFENYQYNMNRSSINDAMKVSLRHVAVVQYLLSKEIHWINRPNKKSVDCCFALSSVPFGTREVFNYFLNQKNELTVTPSQDNVNKIFHSLISDMYLFHDIRFREPNLT